jgi:hypothetical protein
MLALIFTVILELVGMSSLNVQRLVVWGVGLLLGFVTAFLIITVGFDLLPISRGVTVDEYGIVYFLVTAVPLGLVYVIWLDYFMETNILPD